MAISACAQGLCRVKAIRQDLCSGFACLRKKGIRCGVGDDRCFVLSDCRSLHIIDWRSGVTRTLDHRLCVRVVVILADVRTTP